MSGSGCAERYRADVRVEDQKPTLSGTRHARAVCAPDKADRDRGDTGHRQAVVLALFGTATSRYILPLMVEADAAAG